MAKIHDLFSGRVARPARPPDTVSMSSIKKSAPLTKETTMTTDKNNFFHPGATAPGFKSAARLRGEKEEVVFTSCFCCFPKNL